MSDDWNLILVNQAISTLWLKNSDSQRIKRQVLLSGEASAPASCSTETSHQSPFIATILTRFCRS